MSPEETASRRAAAMAFVIVFAAGRGIVADRADVPAGPRAEGDRPPGAGAQGPAGALGAALPPASETLFHRLTDVELANASADLLGLPRVGRSNLAKKVAPAPS